MGHSYRKIDKADFPNALIREREQELNSYFAAILLFDMLMEL